MEKHMFRNRLFCIGLGLMLAGTAVVPAQAEDEEERPLGWSTELVGGLALTQTEFENYAEGGESSLTWATSLDFEAFLNRENREWKTTAALQFGQTRLGDGDFRKAADRISVETVHTWKLHRLVDPYVSVDARTQFAKSFTYTEDMRGPEISRFANPLYLNEGAGIGRRFNAWLHSRLGFAVHEVFVTEEQFAAAYTDDPETADLEKTRVDTGMELVTEYERNWEEEKVKVKSQLKLFSTFDAPDKIDVNWNTVLTANLISFIDVIASAEVIYDEDILKRTQLKEVLALGITHTFF